MKALYGTALSALISTIVAAIAIGGFLLGRNYASDAYITKVAKLLAVESNVMSIATFYGIVGKPAPQRELAKLYEVSPDDPAALASALDKAAAGPPYRMAPFIGHMARPVFGDDLQINMLGFRDHRQSYVTKPKGTVRIFMTGGSTVWGFGAPSQKSTLSYLLEEILNDRISRTTGYRYEVINTGFPAWSTTQEKILIQQRLVDMHPDVVLMYSGNNDVSWALYGRDIRWFYNHNDQNFVTMVNEVYKSSGHPERATPFPLSSRPMTCPDVGRITLRNVEEAAFAAGRVKARLIFALQPNIVSAAKRLTERERTILAAENKPFWDACYKALRDNLGQIAASNYRFFDLSRSVPELSEDTELFLDAVHFADRGNRLMAQALADGIDWGSIAPNDVAAGTIEPLSIVGVEGRGGTLRLVPNRINGNLQVIFDRTILETAIGTDAVTAVLPAWLSARGEHLIFIADGVTGETSPPVVWKNVLDQK